jgi:hypothetical protein
VVIIFTGPKLKHVMSPKEPTVRPSLLLPNACAASSMTRRSCWRAMRVSSSIWAGSPR